MSDEKLERAVLDRVTEKPGIAERELKDDPAFQYSFVDGALEQLHDAGKILFDAEGHIFPASHEPKPTVVRIALRYGHGTHSGGGIDTRILTQAIREDPKTAAFEIARNREYIAVLERAQARPPSGNLRALAASFHSYPGDLDLLPEKRGGDFPAAFPKVYAAATWGPLTHAEQHVVAFLHYVWNGSVDGERRGSRVVKAKFDFEDAIRSWDESNRAAFVAWLQEPWFM